MLIAKTIGWDGRSRAITVLQDDCGCQWTADGRARLSACSDCLHEAVAREQNHDRHHTTWTLDATQLRRLADAMGVSDAVQVTVANRIDMTGVFED